MVAEGETPANSFPPGQKGGKQLPRLVPGQESPSAQVQGGTVTL